MKEVVRFYNRISEKKALTQEDIPDDVFEFICNLPSIALVQPFVIDDIRKGLSENTICRKHMIGRRRVRTIKKKMV